MYGQNNGYYMPNYNPYMAQYNGAMPDMLNQMKTPYQQANINPAQNYQPIISSNPISDMIWVLNENEATSYPVAPNNSVVLWDKNNPTIYVKSVNSQGMPSMRVLDFAERIDNSKKEPTEHICKCGDRYATKEQFEALRNEFEALTAKYNDIIEKQDIKSAKTTKKEVE